MADVMIVLESFTGRLDGRQVTYIKGEAVAANDPAVAKWPALFGPVPLRHAKIAEIEQATAAPGEKRESDFGARMAAARAAKRGGK
jgi:hypothetical protein